MIKISLSKKGWLAVAAGLVLAILFLTVAWVFGIIALVISFITLSINMLWGFLVWLMAQLGLTAVFGWLITQITAMFTWFASTWLGSLIMPLYTWVAPIVSKFGPLVTMSKWGKNFWKKFRQFRSKGKAEIGAIIEHEDIKP